jgi:small redox-active disulfide protein 2
MKIEVLGTGCSKCKRLEKNVEKALKISSKKAEVVKIEDYNEILEKGVMITPGLIIDGKVASTGTVLSPDEIIKLIS